MTGDFFRLRQGNSILLCLPADYIAGKMIIVRAFVLNLNLVIVKPSANPAKWVTAKYLDFAAMVPYQVQSILQTNPDFLETINTLIIGGSSIDKQLVAKLKEVSSKVFISYGMTETLGHIAVKRVSDQFDDTGYQALPGVVLTADSRGCLNISVEHLEIENLVTNDLVSFVSFNQFHFLGRIDNVINSGGIKIIPEEVEGCLETRMNGRRFMLAGFPDARLGERVDLFIEGSVFHENKMKQLRTYCERQFNRYSRPKEIHFIPQFKLTPSGKIKRKATLRVFLETLKKD